LIYIDDHIWDFDLQEALEAVSPQRRTYALRYHQERDQRLCIAAYRLLQQALWQEYGMAQVPEFYHNAAGKPLLNGHPEIHFSLSHCHQAVACVLSDQPVGIDVETFDHYSQEVASRVMNDNEMRQILNSPHPTIAFARLWTMKESLFKLTGDDHGGDIAHMLDDTAQYHFSTLITPHYALTHCTTTQASNKQAFSLKTNN